jgi:hypothetical protein
MGPGAFVEEGDVASPQASAARTNSASAIWVRLMESLSLGAYPKGRDLLIVASARLDD